MAILIENIKSNFFSICIAAQELIDIEKFYSYNSIEDIKTDKEAFFETIASLRYLHPKARAA